jgi:type II secretory ATPase GspE/PulE/Tfp pilus assembly ATPase PilB-like protein
MNEIKLSVSTIHDEHTVVRLVDQLIQDAIARRASDIHLEPTSGGLRTRFRIDGVLLDQPSISLTHMPQVISRIKVLAHVNITEKRIPQDGKFTIQGHGPVDLRVSTFPALYGQKIVVRILDRGTHTMALENLGFYPDVLNQFRQLIRRSNGFFLVAGPTGSGKTTTLYAALAALHDPTKNIMTLEDPVEYNLEGITQGQINTDTGFTFEKGIRAVLRQDPDIVMVGEMRDKQTARIAIEAALTGHLVLSTVHTNDAPSVIMRLMDMGIEPFLINAALTGVLAQRLARKICSTCREPVEPHKEEQMMLKKLGLSDNIVLYKGTGCSSCNQLGYKGRIGLFELLCVSSGLRSLIIKHPIFDAIYMQASQDGMRTLLQDGIQKVVDGVITLEELMRVVG